VTSDPSARAAEDAIESRTDRLLRRAMSRHERVGRIAQQRKHAALAVLREARQVVVFASTGV